MQMRHHILLLTIYVQNKYLKELKKTKPLTVAIREPPQAQKCNSFLCGHVNRIQKRELQPHTSVYAFMFRHIKNMTMIGLFVVYAAHPPRNIHYLLWCSIITS